MGHVHGDGLGFRSFHGFARHWAAVAVVSGEPEPSPSLILRPAIAASGSGLLLPAALLLAAHVVKRSRPVPTDGDRPGSYDFDQG